MPWRPNILGSSSPNNARLTLLSLNFRLSIVCFSVNENSHRHSFALLSFCTMDTLNYVTNKACDQSQGFFSVHGLCQGLNEKVFSNIKQLTIVEWWVFWAVVSIQSEMLLKHLIKKCFTEADKVLNCSQVSSFPLCKYKESFCIDSSVGDPIGWGNPLM